MTREEYEQRKRRLEEQLRAGIELLEVGYREQMRALELIWRARSQEGMAPAAPAVPETTPPPAVQGEAPGPAPAAPPKRRRGAGELLEEVVEALDSLPEVFDHNQVCAVLGYQPDRSSLFRIFRELTSEDILAVEKFGRGRVATKYRKIETDSSPDDL